MNFPRRIKYRLIDSILQKPVPVDGVIRIGSGVELVDAKIIRFLRNDDPWLIVERREAGELICSTWNGTTQEGETRHSIDVFRDAQYKIKHYYGPSTIHFESLTDYAVGYYLRVPYLRIHIRRALERAETYLYDRRRIVLKQRLELLTFMIEQAADGTKAFTSLDLMTDMHTIRWITHPDGESVRNRLELYLDSLADTGELRKVNTDYVLTGHALKLAEERAVLERQHRQSIRTQLMIAALTAATVILTIFQAGLIKLNPFWDLTK
jgi:hypothetical protein